MTETYNSFIKLAHDRYSCRSYSSTAVPRDMIEAVVEAARLAPSACNRQPWVFVVLDSPEQRAMISAVYGRDWAAGASAFIVAVGLHGEAWHRASDGKDHTDVDVAIAVEHICLAAAAAGLGTCWICNFDAAALASEMNLPEGAEPVAIIPIGFPAEGSKVPDKNRKKIDEILRWGKF
ncbi:MAG: nitroreductase family protein [Muribaculaceae bacterium]|nr:nitroreductase family protein [Muribaculaceae bacterium]